MNPEFKHALAHIPHPMEGEREGRKLFLCVYLNG